MNKTQQEILDQLEIGEDYEDITNPFSGVTVQLDPRGVALYDYIHGAALLGLGVEQIQAKMLFAELYPEYYMILID